MQFFTNFLEFLERNRTKIVIFMEKCEEKLREDVRMIRKSLRITQKEMGQALGVTESAYNRIESGDIAISYAHLLGFAEAFKMSIAEILAYPASTCNDSGERPTCTTHKKCAPNKIMIELEIGTDEVVKMRLKDNIYQLTQ